MQIKVIRGSFGIVLLILAVLIIFILPAFLFFAVLATAVSLIGATLRLLGNTKKPTLNQTHERGTVIDAAQIE
jgi:hypothetical protein